MLVNQHLLPILHHLPFPLILPTNRQISVPILLQFASKFKIVKIMSFNNKKLNYVRLCGKYVNLSNIGPL